MPETPTIRLKPLTLAIERGGRSAVVRLAAAGDVEHLRRWKNAHRESFFHKAEITAEEQARWFEAFARRTDAAMYVLDLDGAPTACVGFRETGPQRLELFNLILGDPESARTGLMSAFYRALEAELRARGAAAIHLVVLTGNTSAIAFYGRNGFRPTGGPAPEGSTAMERTLA